MESIGPYELLEKIGEGGMASVYKGRQASLDRLVAIKVLSKRLTEDQEIVERFNRESLIIAKLSHPNIIHVIDRGINNGRPYFVMDYIEGENLASLIHNASDERNLKLELMIQVCRALSYAHKNGVIHRDIKPANILIDREGNALVSDFGIAQLFQNGESGDPLTKEGVIMGTPVYMSPEQKLDSNKVTALSDIYSLGTVMFELFTGKKPLGRFKLPTEIDSNLPQALEEVILKCLEPEPSFRMQSADEVKDCLLKILQGAHLHESQKDRAYQGISSMEDKFSLLDVIKENEFGAVYLLEDKKDHELMVLKKCVRKSGGWTEARALSRLRHKNILNILGVSENTQCFIIVMEYLSGGSLKDRLTMDHEWRWVVSLSKEIGEGLRFAHENQIVHGNLRPSNILLSHAGDIKIADFGMEEHYQSGGMNRNWYSVPNEHRSTQGDVFSVGVMLYQLLMGALPMWRGGELFPPIKFRVFPPELQALISKMTSRRLSNRFLSFEEVIPQIDAILDASARSKTQALPPRNTSQKNPPQTSRILWLFFILLTLTSFYFVLESQEEMAQFIGHARTWLQEIQESLSSRIKSLKE